MTRTKNFTRESVLNKSIPLFLRKGFADTSIQDLEEATGVNKSGLYSEFESKENLFSACIDHFSEFKSAKRVLLNEPFGWSNVEAFLLFVAECDKKSENGCFVMYSMREYGSFSKSLKAHNEKYVEELRLLLERNISVEKTKTKAKTIANIALRFFAGGALLQNVHGLEKTDRSQSVKGLMTILRSL